LVLTFPDVAIRAAAYKADNFDVCKLHNVQEFLESIMLYGNLSFFVNVLIRDALTKQITV